MSNRRTYLTPGHDGHARRRAPRPLDLFTPPADDRTAAAMDDVEQAEQLIADLLALVDADLIEPIADSEGCTRYAPRGDDLDPPDGETRR